MVWPLHWGISFQIIDEDLKCLASSAGSGFSLQGRLEDNRARVSMLNSHQEIFQYPLLSLDWLSGI